MQNECLPDYLTARQWFQCKKLIFPSCCVQKYSCLRIKWPLSLYICLVYSSQTRSLTFLECILNTGSIYKHYQPTDPLLKAPGAMCTPASYLHPLFHQLIYWVYTPWPPLRVVNNTDMDATLVKWERTGIHQIVTKNKITKANDMTKEKTNVLI